METINSSNQSSSCLSLSAQNCQSEGYFYKNELTFTKEVNNKNTKLRFCLPSRNENSWSYLHNWNNFQLHKMKNFRQLCLIWSCYFLHRYLSSLNCWNWNCCGSFYHGKEVLFKLYHFYYPIELNTFNQADEIFEYKVWNLIESYF